MNSIIQDWNQLLQTTPTDQIYEAAFLRIYIEHEVFLSETFLKFSLGQGVGTYTPERKIDFVDEKQIRALIQGEGSFIDFSRAIHRCSPYIFSKDPFTLLQSAINFADDIKKMKCIRNYLAHRSTEAKDSYVRKVLKLYNIQDFIEPGVFLRLKMKSKSQTYYGNYCQVLLEVYEMLNNDALLSEI